jgi:DNA-binding NarL/FixJ family response regulator
MTSVLIVDDHASVRAGIEAFLGAERDLRVAAAVATAAQAEAACSEHRPDVLVADYHLPDQDGLTLCLRLGEGGGPPVVLFSAFADENLGVLAMIAGARAMVSKSSDPRDLVAAVHAVARGERAMPAAGARALRAAGERLDGDDLPVLGMLVHGVPPAEIAQTLGIEERWLGARRRGMLELLRRGSRRGSPRREGGRRVRAA